MAMRRRIRHVRLCTADEGPSPDIRFKDIELLAKKLVRGFPLATTFEYAFGDHPHNDGPKEGDFEIIETAEV